MNLTILFLIVAIAALAAHLIFHEGIAPLLHGKTVLKVTLRKRYWIDQLIFLVILIVLTIANDVRRGDSRVSLLLLVFTILFVFFTFFSAPKAWFKDHGFVYGFGFIDYNRVKNMRLSEDGILVIDTDRRRVLLSAKRIEDLEQILKIFVEK
ncbi:MAG: DUF986 family protein [Sporolactobacillus sp.]